MKSVTLCSPEEHFLGQQTLPPKRNQANAVES
jgi:hypothetical protein